MRKTSLSRFCLLAILFLAMVWGFHALIFVHAPVVFNDELEDMSFGWYVPIFSMYVIWAERKKILASLGSPSIWGALATIPFLFIGFLGVRGIQIRFEILSFVGLLITIPWALFGARTAKAVLFPALFLLFCIPLATFLDIITVHLRLFSTGLAYAILKGFGAAVSRTGTMLQATDGSFAIDIAQPCSGLRSIFALMALTAGYAYFNQPTWLRRGLLFACSVPLAILGNVMRILTICLVGTYASSEFATGFYHDYSGYVVFIVAIVFMVALGEGITRLAKRFGGGKAKAAVEEDTSSSKPCGRRKFVVPGLTAVLVLTTMAFIANTSEPYVPEAPKVKLGEIEFMSSKEVEISEAEAERLPKDTQIMKRQYVDAAGNYYAVSVVIGGTSKSSIHRPELCLPSQGFLMTEPRTREAGGKSWRLITLDGNGKRPSLGFAYTFFNQEGFHTSSHTGRIFRDVWDRSLLNRIDRWVMVTVNSTVTDETKLLYFLTRLQEALK